jgi:hypothetical protein
MRLQFCASLVVAMPLWAHAACEAVSGPGLTPVVELYTSEGCSDCPPADAWLSKRAVSDDTTSFLAFHVSYWDDVGWPDRFALALNDRRQELRVRLAGKDVVYTPQVMIGAATTVNWRHGGSKGADGLLRSLQGRNAQVDLAMSVVREHDGLRVAFDAERSNAAPAGEVWIWLVAYEDGLTTAIEAGENKGKMLRHDRVVRALLGPWLLAGRRISQRTMLPLPADMNQEKAGIVLFAESSADASTLQSLRLSLGACAAPAGG